MPQVESIIQHLEGERRAAYDTVNALLAVVCGKGVLREST